MEMIKRTLYSVLFIFFSTGIGHSQEFRQSVDMRVPFVPGLVTINGKPAVYYELHLVNFASDSMDLKKVEVFDAADSAIVATMDKDDLKNRYSRPGVLREDKENILLAPGSSGIIYIEFALQNDASHVQLYHCLELGTRRGQIGKTILVQGALIHLSQKAPVVLGPPLGSGFWAAIYEPSWERGHRRVFYTVNGKARIPGRFAIDFIRLDSLGLYAKGDNNVVKNWYGYGVDVLAVNDAVVLSTRDDFSESTTLSTHPVHSADKATGNYVSIDIGNDHIVFYEHLKPGSIKVKPGQKIKKGDIIAAVGFTGQTTGPHLHFHVANANSALGAEGIPFVLERFTLAGSYSNFEKFGKEPWIPVKDLSKPIITGERPAPNSVIKFQP
jgi:murein DD-endopeptidase MepM/ murein hydrolase activator NlpD